MNGKGHFRYQHISFSILFESCLYVICLEQCSVRLSVTSFLAAFLRHFYGAAVPRARILVVLRQRLLHSEDCARGCNQARRAAPRRHEARFSVLLRIGRTYRKVTHAHALIYRYSACRRDRPINND